MNLIRDKITVFEVYFDQRFAQEDSYSNETALSLRSRRNGH